MHTPAVGPTQPLIQCIPGLFPGGHSAAAWHNHLPPSHTKGKNEWSQNSLPLHTFIALAGTAWLYRSFIALAGTAWLYRSFIALAGTVWLPFVHSIGMFRMWRFLYLYSNKNRLCVSIQLWVACLIKTYILSAIHQTTTSPTTNTLTTTSSSSSQWQ